MNDLIIDKSIFGEAALIQAIGAYASLCEISVRENVNQYICHFDKCKYGEERTLFGSGEINHSGSGEINQF